MFTAWGVAQDLTTPMVAGFKRIFEMSTFQASLVQLAYFGAWATGVHSDFTDQGLVGIAIVVFVVNQDVDGEGKRSRDHKRVRDGSGTCGHACCCHRLSQVFRTYRS